MRWDLERANEHARARRTAAPGGYGNAWQWVRAHLPRIGWTGKRG